MMTSETYRRLVERSPDGILVSQDGILILVNPAAARLCGRDQPDDLVGTHLNSIFLSDGHAARQERLDQVTSGQAVAAFEEQIVRLDGGITDVEVAVTRLDDLDCSPGSVSTQRSSSRCAGFPNASGPTPRSAKAKSG